jgi:hypothetical protein
MTTDVQNFDEELSKVVVDPMKRVPNPIVFQNFKIEKSKIQFDSIRQTHRGRAMIA